MPGELVLACVLMAGLPASSFRLPASGFAADNADYAEYRAVPGRLPTVAVAEVGEQETDLARLWEAAARAPQDADVQNRLGEALERIGALDAAIDAYRSALAARPDFRTASNNLILTLVKAGKGEEAVRRALALTAAAPDDPDRHFTLGLAQSEQNVADAIASFRRVLALAPRHVLARYNLALVLKRADRLPEAVGELERAIAIEPRPEIHYTLAVLYWHQGDNGGAVRRLRDAVALQPDYADAHYTLGAVLKSTRDWNGAAASLRRAIALRPDLPSAHYTLSQVLQASGDARGAREHLAEAERLRLRAQAEQEAGVKTSVGIRQLDAGDPAAAVVSFRGAIAAFEPYAPAHYQLGRALQRLNRAEEARAAFARARQLNPSLVPPPDGRSPK